MSLWRACEVGVGAEASVLSCSWYDKKIARDVDRLVRAQKEVFGGVSHLLNLIKVSGFIG